MWDDMYRQLDAETLKGKKKILFAHNVELKRNKMTKLTLFLVVMHASRYIALSSLTLNLLLTIAPIMILKMTNKFMKPCEENKCTHHHQNSFILLLLRDFILSGCQLTQCTGSAVNSL